MPNRHAIKWPPIALPAAIVSFICALLAVPARAAELSIANETLSAPLVNSPLSLAQYSL